MFELGQRSEDGEHETSGGRGTVDRRTLTGQDPQSDLAICQTGDHRYEVG